MLASARVVRYQDIVHMVVVFTPDPVDMQGDTSGKGERLEQMGNHLG